MLVVEKFPDSLVVRWQWRAKGLVHQHSWVFSFEACEPVSHMYVELPEKLML